MTALHIGNSICNNMSLHDIASWSEYYLTDDISAKDWKRFVLDFRSKFVYFLTLKIAHVKEDIRYFKYKQINACLWKDIHIKHYTAGEYCDELFLDCVEIFCNEELHYHTTIIISQ